MLLIADCVCFISWTSAEDDRLLANDTELWAQRGKEEGDARVRFLTGDEDASGGESYTERSGTVRVSM